MKPCLCVFLLVTVVPWANLIYGVEINNPKSIRKIDFVDVSTISNVVIQGRHGPEEYTRVLPQSKQAKPTNAVLMLPKVSIQKLENFLLKDIESKEYSSELESLGSVECGKTDVEQFGWIKGQRIAILGCTCIPLGESLKQRKLSFVGFIRTTNTGLPIKILHVFKGADDLQYDTEGRNIYSVKHVTNLDSDLDCEVVVDNIRYAGSFEDIVDIKSDDVVSIKQIHSDAWD